MLLSLLCGPLSSTHVLGFGALSVRCPEQDVNLLPCLVCWCSCVFRSAILRLFEMCLVCSVFCQPTIPPRVLSVCCFHLNLISLVRPRSVCLSQRGSSHWRFRCLVDLSLKRHEVIFCVFLTQCSTCWQYVLRSRRCCSVTSPISTSDAAGEVLRASPFSNATILLTASLKYHWERVPRASVRGRDATNDSRPRMKIIHLNTQTYETGDISTVTDQPLQVIAQLRWLQHVYVLALAHQQQRIDCHNCAGAACGTLCKFPPFNSSETRRTSLPQ